MSFLNKTFQFVCESTIWQIILQISQQDRHYIWHLISTYPVVLWIYQHRLASHGWVLMNTQFHTSVPNLLCWFGLLRLLCFENLQKTMCYCSYQNVDHIFRPIYEAWHHCADATMLVVRRFLKFHIAIVNLEYCINVNNVAVFLVPCIEVSPNNHMFFWDKSGKWCTAMYALYNSWQTYLECV